MSHDRLERAKEICDRALAHGPEERSAYVARACRGDEALRRRVDSLLERRADESLDETRAFPLRTDARDRRDGASPATARAPGDLKKLCTRCNSRYGSGVVVCPTDGEVLVEDPEALVGVTLDGRYQIERVLGAGGFGVVYLARHVHLRDYVAIKVLPASVSSNRDWVRRFLREGRAARAIHHPAAVAVYDLQVSGDNVTYMVQEYVEGRSLRRELELRRSLPPGEVLSILAPIAGALDAAHAAGIVHRDVKPDNVMVGEGGGERVVKLLDLGIAKLREIMSTSMAESAELTGEGQIIGTPHYMSPEQWGELPRDRVAEIDGRTDVYSLGVMAYEMVAGQKPFLGRTMAELRVAHLTQPPRPLREHVPDLPDEFAAAVEAALSKDRGGRPASAGELVRRMRASLGPIEDTLREPAGASRGGRAAAAARMQATSPGRAAAKTPAAPGGEAALATSPPAGETGPRTARSSVWERARGMASSVPLRVAAGAFLGIAALAAVVWVVALWRAPSAYQPQPEALRWYAAGTEALRDGTYMKARRSLEQAVKLDDRFALAHARLAEAWAELGYNDRASAEIGRARSLAPDLSSLPAVDGLYLKAINDTLSRDLPAAIGSYARIAELAPEGEQQYALLDLGRAYEKNEDSEKALENYTKAAERDPQYAAAFLRAAVLHGRLKALPEAAAAFDRAEALYQANSNLEGVCEVCYQRGTVLNINNRESEARPQLERALALAETTENESQQIRALLQLGVASIGSDISKATAYAQRAIDLAQTRGMEGLTARGLVDLGSSFFAGGQVEKAEAYFRKALDFAVSHDSPENEARARISLGSLLIQTRRLDAGLPEVERALAFFRKGGYRTETCQCLILVGRVKSLAGDYPVALAAFEEQLQVARQLGDAYLVALALEGIGAVFRTTERYPESLAQFTESYKSSKSIGDTQGVGYGALNRAGALIRLGRYAEAETAAAEAEGIAQSAAGSEMLMAFVHQLRADVALGKGLHREAVALGEKALTAIAGQDPEMAADAKRTIGLAQSRSGAYAVGKSTCAEAVRLAEESANPSIVSATRLALAEAMLADGDAPGALALASQLEDGFARSGQSESQWRSLVLAAACSARLGDGAKAAEYAARAVGAWAAVKAAVGDEAFAAYAARADVARDLKTMQDLSSGAR